MIWITGTEWELSNHVICGMVHAEIVVPKGSLWLRTGVYDRNSRKVGTMEIPLAAVKPFETAAVQ